MHYLKEEDHYSFLNRIVYWISLNCELVQCYPVCMYPYHGLLFALLIAYVERGQYKQNAFVLSVLFHQAQAV